MCAKVCTKHGHDKKKKLCRRILIGAGIFVMVVAVAIFIVWLILRPVNPQFTIQDATIYAFNLSQPTFVTTTMQVTVSTRNPNSKMGIYYNDIQIYASYRNEQITLATELPPGTYVGQKDISIWSPFLYGNSVPVSPDLAAAIDEDLNAGLVLLEIKISGTLNWKVGTWMSGNYYLSARCPAYITSGGPFHGGGPLQFGNKYQVASGCYVQVALN